MYLFDMEYLCLFVYNSGKLNLKLNNNNFFANCAYMTHGDEEKNEREKQISNKL